MRGAPPRSRAALRAGLRAGSACAVLAPLPARAAVIHSAAARSALAAAGNSPLVAAIRSAAIRSAVAGVLAAILAASGSGDARADAPPPSGAPALLPAGGPAGGPAAAPPGAGVPVPTPDQAFQISPYVWASGVSGRVSPFRRTPTVPLDLSFGELLDDLRFGGFVMAYARRDRFVATADVLYVDLAERQDIRALPGLGPTPGLSARVESTQFAAALMAGWRAAEGPRGTLDLLAGARFWSISTEVSARTGGLARSWSEDFSWIDPILGFRALLPLALPSLGDRLSALVQADAGVGPRETWGALAALNLALGDRAAVSLGYKALSVDYDQGGHVFDATLRGPALGLTWRF